MESDLDRNLVGSDMIGLIRRAQSGEVLAFNLLVRLEQDEAYCFALRFLGSREAAELATKNAIINAYRNIRSFRGGNFRFWLLRIVANMALDQIHRGRHGGQRSMANRFHESDMSFIESSEGALQVALMELSEQCRLVVVLSDIQRLTYEEIAYSFAIPVDVVKSRLALGRGRLRDILYDSMVPSIKEERPRHMGAISIRSFLRLCRRLVRSYAGNVSKDRDKRLSAYLDGDWSLPETPALQSEIANDPALNSSLTGMRRVLDELAGHREVSVPRAFTLEVAAKYLRSFRLEWPILITATATALMFASALMGNVVTKGDGFRFPVLLP